MSLFIQKIPSLSSVLSIAAQITEQYPWLVENGVLDELIPKKSDLVVIKLCVVVVVVKITV